MTVQELVVKLSAMPNQDSVVAFVEDGIASEITLVTDDPREVGFDDENSQFSREDNEERLLSNTVYLRSPPHIFELMSEVEYSG